MVLTAQGHRADGALGCVVAELQKAVFEIEPCLWHARERIFDRLGRRRLAGDFTQLLFEPCLQIVEDGLSVCLFM